MVDVTINSRKKYAETKRTLMCSQDDYGLCVYEPINFMFNLGLHTKVNFSDTIGHLLSTAMTKIKDELWFAPSCDTNML